MLADARLNDALLAFVVPAGILLGMTLAGALIELTVLRHLRHLVARSAWPGGGMILAALRGKVALWAALLGVALALPYSPWQLDERARLYVHNGALVVFILTLTFLVAHVAASLISTATRPDTRPALSLITNIVRVTIYVIGAVTILGLLGVSVTPALAALGVGGLAVSLALQATLSDLFSGLQVIMARQIRPGDYIKLSTGEEGYVTDIHWRTTTIRQLANNLVIIPNAKMTSTIVTNYHAPEKILSVLVDLGVSYDADLERVERVTLEVAGEVMRTAPGGVPELEPALRFTEFGESSVQLRVILKGQEYADQYVLKHELIKRLHQRYRAEGIEIPFPVRTLRLKREDAPTLAELAAPPTPASLPVERNGHAAE